MADERPAGGVGITGRVLGFFSSNPLIGALATFSSIIGIPLAIGLTLLTQQTRELVYMMNAPPTVIVQGGQASSLTVEFKGQPISGDVNVIQVLLWNAGNASIRPENVLDPVHIVFAGPTRVLEAKIVRRSRDTTGLSVSQDESVLARGHVPLAFRILEKRDCAVVQLVYVGRRDVTVEVLGSIEGQSQIRGLGQVTPEVRDQGGTVVGVILAICFLIFAMCVAVYFTRRAWRMFLGAKAGANRRQTVLGLAGMIGGVGVIVGIGFLLYVVQARMFVLPKCASAENGTSSVSAPSAKQ